MDPKIQTMVKAVVRRDPTLGPLQALERVEAKLVSVINNQRAPDTDVATTLGIFKAIDEASGRPEFLEDPKLAKAYTTGVDTEPATFWSRWWTPMLNHRNELWRTIHAQDS